MVFHYGNFPQSTQSLADRGVALHGLCTWWDVLAAAERRGVAAADIDQEPRGKAKASDHTPVWIELATA